VLWGRVNAAIPLARSTHSGALGIDSLLGRWLPAMRRLITGVRADRQKRSPKTPLWRSGSGLSKDLCAEPLAGPWLRLGACRACPVSPEF
jgi:hypothetical protein